jgi:hypothetical protein
VVFDYTTKAGIKCRYVEIVQTGGVSDSSSGIKFPEFRRFNIKDLCNVKLIPESLFEANYESYNPESSWYENALAKVD